MAYHRPGPRRSDVVAAAVVARHRRLGAVGAGDGSTGERAATPPTLPSGGDHSRVFDDAVVACARAVTARSDRFVAH